MKPSVIIFSGYGVNGEEETKVSFEEAGARADIVHINDIISNPKILDKYQIISFPPGFSYGDDTGSGNAYANKLRNHLWMKLQGLINKDVLILGVCNGFQILVNLGLIPALSVSGKRQAALTHNEKARFSARWVDLKVISESVWLKDVEEFSLPIAHGEGRFYADEKTLDLIEKRGQVALRYCKGEVVTFQDLDPNPNGSLRDIAGITDPSGRILCLMPHPDRAIFFTQLPHWTYLKEQYLREGKALPKYTEAFKIFQNAVKYFK
jgi:phosphoribosylformylglycinamidine synthase subunit PurQ / glutaminase